MKKGFIFTMDAMIALSVIIMIILTVAFVEFETILPEKRYEKLNLMADDTMNLLEYLEAYEVKETPTIKSLIEKGELEKRDLNKTVLDLIASFWYKGNYSIAENISKDVLQGLTDSFCVALSIDGQNIYSSCSTQADKIAVSSRIESGYEPGKTGYGYVAGAELTDIRGKRDSSFVYFGGYVGEGNITGILTLPPYDEILEAYMEMNTNSNFTLYINDNYSGYFVNNTAGGGNMTADKWLVCNESYHPEYCLNFTTGKNTLEFNFTANNSYIGGGYFRVTYNTNQLAPEKDPNKDWYWFPGIKGFINLYDSFYVPGILNNMTMRLHYFNNLSFGGAKVPVYVTFPIGNKEVYRSSDIGVKDVTLNYNDILNKLGVSSTDFINNVSNKTVPITFGTDMTKIMGKGIADAVLITDVSGSMDTYDVQPGPQQRLAVAKAVDIEFINGTDGILTYSGNRVGLVAYSSTPGIRRMHDMSNNESELVTHINNYNAAGCTCISCGIQKAIDMLSLTYKIDTYVHERDFWFYNTSYPASDPPTINGKNWNEIGYDVSGWINKSAILGFDNYPYIPYISTNIGNNGGNYYFIKNFTVENITSLDSAYLYVLSDNRTDVYLNGQLIDSDSINHNATYWNRIGNVIFYDGFETYSSSLCRRVRGNDMNVAPGFWSISDHGGSNDGFINLTCNKPNHPAFNGSNVLTMSHMDATGSSDFGYIEKTLNLIGRSNVRLSYWWKLKGNFEFNTPSNVEEHALIQVWDGQWHTVAMHNSDQDDGTYHYQEIDLSPYNMTNNFKIRFSSKSNNNNDVFYLDDVKVWIPIKVDKSKFVEGDNVIAIKLYNNDGKSAKFDLKLEGNITENRKKAMLIMSDGIANTLIPGDDACGGDPAGKWEAVNKSCEARNKYGINVYSVAFGTQAELEPLNRSACWNCTACPKTGMTCNYGQSTCVSRGCYWTGSSCTIPSRCWVSDCNPVYSSNNADELKSIYRKIAKDIVELSYAAQKVNITGEVPLKNILYPDSYIEYNYTPVLFVNPNEHGKVSITREGKRFREFTGENFITDQTTKTKEGWYDIPDGVTVVDAKITSYSSEFWTDRLLMNSSSTGNWITLYNLTDYSTDYRGLGDPYIIQIPVNYVKTGNNSFKIGAGYSSDDGTIKGVGGSPDDRLIYTIRIRGRVGYNESFPTLNEAIEDAKRRLNDTIKIYDVYIEDQDINVDYKSYAGIRSIWGPSLLKVITWEK